MAGQRCRTQLFLLMDLKVVHDDRSEKVDEDEIFCDDKHEKVQKYRVNSIVYAVGSLCCTDFVIELKPVVQCNQLKQCETRRVHGPKLGW